MIYSTEFDRVSPKLSLRSHCNYPLGRGNLYPSKLHLLAELLGYASRPTLKADTERFVKRIEGVESVTNNFEVLPVSFSDDRIRLAAYRAIYGNTVL
jgi:hypothetical protein